MPSAVHANEEDRLLVLVTWQNILRLAKIRGFIFYFSEDIDRPKALLGTI